MFSLPTSQLGFDRRYQSNTGVNILIIENEARAAAFIKRGLTEMMFLVTVASEGRDGLKMAIEGNPDLLLINNLLPDMSGAEVCRLIREHNQNLPVMLLSANDTIKERILCLDSGADDYMAIPFYFDELAARIRALNRRKLVTSGNMVWQAADLEMDRHAMEVRRNGRRIHLSNKEQRLLEVLISNKNKVLSKDFLAHAVWGEGFDGTSNFVEVYISYLRAKIDKEAPVKLLHTVSGLGYVLRD